MSLKNVLSLDKPQFMLDELLENGSRVLYENIFSMRHIGRVLDFMLHEAKPFLQRTQDPAWHEYRIRQAVEVAAFNAWINYRSLDQVKCLEFEFGWDEQKILFSISAYIDPKWSEVMPPADLSADKNLVQRFISEVESRTDGLIVRHNPKTGRFHLIGIIDVQSLSTSMNRQVEREPSQYFQVELNESTVKNTDVTVVPLFKAKAEGLDEQESLGDGSQKVGFNSAEDAFTTKVVGESLSKDVDIEKISSSSKSSNEDKIVVSSSFDEKESDLIKVKGSSDSSDLSDVHKVVGGSSQESSQEKSTEKLKLSDNKVDEDLLKAVQNAASITDKDSDGVDVKETEESIAVLLNTVKADIHPLCPNLNDSQFQEAFRALSQKIRENYTQTLHHLMRVKNIQTISKMKHYKDQISMLSGRIDELKREKNDLINALAQADPSQAEYLKLTNEVKEEKMGLASQSSKSVQKSDSSLEASEATFKNLMQNFKRAVDEDKSPSVAKQRYEQFMQDLLRDRSVLNQKMRDADAILRKNELDLKSKETSFKEQLRIKDEVLKQKEFTLEKTKESLSDALKNLDLSRKDVTAESIDRNELQNKFNTVDRLLTVAQSNNERMQKRVDELQLKWQEEFNKRSQLQDDLSKQNRKIDDLMKKIEVSEKGVEHGEVAHVTQQRDRALKQLEELKKQNREINEKLLQATNSAKASAADLSKKTGIGGVGDAESKHKLEQANKLVRSMKDELERSRKKFDEIKLEETKLRVEVGRLQNQVKMMSKVSNANASTAQAQSSNSASSAAPKSAIAKPKIKGKF